MIYPLPTLTLTPILPIHTLTRTLILILIPIHLQDRDRTMTKVDAEVKAIHMLVVCRLRLHLPRFTTIIVMDLVET